jgi:hypothetical protein
MLQKAKKIGVIVGVEGALSQVGMYAMSNDTEFIWYGEILTGPKVGAFLTIHQNDVKIIAKVSSEKIIDSQHNFKSQEFDNRYKKNSINRVITLKTSGAIEGQDFQVTSQYVPMVGNEVMLTTEDELAIIYGVKTNEKTISIGKTLLERQPIKLSINKFFASHIGIFGNTGSGKSNTLHKFYLELFRSEYGIGTMINSKFFVIDFNGEYTGKDTFTKSIYKQVYNIYTRDDTKGEKLPVIKNYLFDADILSILFDAKPGVQVPFLRNAMKSWNEKQQLPYFHFGNFITGLLKRILTTGDAVNQNSLQNWLSIAKKYYTGLETGENNNIINCYEFLETLNWHGQMKCYYTSNIFFNSGSENNIDDYKLKLLKIDELSAGLDTKFNKLSRNPTQQLKMFLDFQRVYETSWNKVNEEHLNGLFARMNKSFDSLENAIEVKDDVSSDFKSVNVISLVHANQEITRLIPMLLSKMIYDEQKSAVAGNKVDRTRHLIIDEAHNILNNINQSSGDNWQDYRLGIFEEIIKEGRKFGFYLTLASQRPADISPTILSQVHNYFIHRLVNEKDLRMLENTMPTLDNHSYKMIPSLGKGEAIITGNAMNVPFVVKVDWEKINRPSSDDVELVQLWKTDKEQLENLREIADDYKLLEARCKDSSIVQLDALCCECQEEYICINNDYAPIGLCLSCGAENYICYCNHCEFPVEVSDCDFEKGTHQLCEGCLP